MKIYLLLLSIFLFLGELFSQSKGILVETESFANKGGWVVDQQFMDQMGSPYIMAHGLGIQVNDASTHIKLPESGKYKIFVRTFNWTSPWHEGEGPGKFELILNGDTLPEILGNNGTQWFWQDAGIVSIKDKDLELRLHDLTGFDGRCDAIFLTRDTTFVPPMDGVKLSDFRKSLSEASASQNGGNYDLVVIGGGAAGTCAAVSAARLGLKVALINDRPVLGGNNSSEVRVGLSGESEKNLYPKIGNVLKEFSPRFPSVNAGLKEVYDDNRKIALVLAEDNINLFLNWHVYKTEMQDNKIKSVIAKSIEDGKEMCFYGTLFADCTGDATVGYLAGADYRMGQESRYEFFESLAPLFANQGTLGTSNLWAFETTDSTSTFPIIEWACKFSKQYHFDEKKPDWRWEGGFTKNSITDAENIRDQNLRAIFGNWSYLKNNDQKYANRKLTWVAYIGGKRESRRLLGDIILNQNDIQNQIKYDDASFTTTWSLDLHYPDPKNSTYFPGQEFYSYCTQTDIFPYHVPYRCLYSRNIENLFMAGRNISVTHVAFGSIRVQRTTAMMGEVVGMAASICKEHQTLPRSVYLQYLSELKDLMRKGIPSK